MAVSSSHKKTWAAASRSKICYQIECIGAILAFRVAGLPGDHLEPAAWPNLLLSPSLTLCPLEAQSSWNPQFLALFLGDLS